MPGTDGTETVNISKSIQEILDEGERVEIVAMQKRVGFGGALLDPKTIVITNKRIIISKRQEMGLRVSHEFISFNNIFSVTIVHGIASNAIMLSTWAYNSSELLQRIDGLRYNDAKLIFNYLNKVITPQAGPRQPNALAARASSATGAYIYCRQCGTKNDLSEKYCSNCGAKL